MHDPKTSGRSGCRTRQSVTRPLRGRSGEARTCPVRLQPGDIGLCNGNLILVGRWLKQTVNEAFPLPFEKRCARSLRIIVTKSQRSAVRLAGHGFFARGRAPHADEHNQRQAQGHAAQAITTTEAIDKQEREHRWRGNARFGPDMLSGVMRLCCCPGRAETSSPQDAQRKSSS